LDRCDERIAGDMSQDYFSAPDSFRIRRCLTAFSHVGAKGTAPILAHQGAAARYESKGQC
jgi:hypothetical protein